MQVLGRRADYALRCLVHLAQRQGGVEPARSLALTEHLPEPLLRKILQNLAQAGIVESLRGSRGGFRLCMRPEQTSVLSIVEAVQGRMVIRPCFSDGNSCSSQAFCRLSAKLAPVQRGLVELLRNTTLRDLMEEPGPTAANGGRRRQAIQEQIGCP